jgi:hypothetical protein
MVCLTYYCARNPAKGNPVEIERPQSPEDPAPQTRLRRWLQRWPVLIPLLLVGGLLWLTRWVQARQEFIEAFPEVKFRPPELIGRFGFSDATLKLIGEPRTLAIGGESFERVSPFLDHFQKIERLHVWEMSDAQVRRLPAFSAVEHCRFRRSSLSDESCDVIARWTSLAKLEIRNNPNQEPGFNVTITTAGIKKLTTLTSLRELTLYCPELDTDVFVVLSDFPALEYLLIDGVRVDRRGLQAMARAPEVKVLRLLRCEVDRSALDELAKSDRLVSLDLGGSTVTDEMVQPLSQCSTLKNLDLNGTQVSRAACLVLLELRPELNIQDANGMRVVNSEILDD